MGHAGTRMEYNGVWMEYAWDLDGTRREYGCNMMEYV